MAKVLWHRCVSHAVVQHGYGTKLSVMSCHKMVTTQECVTVSNVKAQNGYNLYDTKITFHVATVLWHKEVSVVLWHYVLMTKMSWHIMIMTGNVVPQLTTVQLSFSFLWGHVFSNFLFEMPGCMVDLSPSIRREAFHGDKLCFDFEVAKWLIMKNVSVYLFKLLTMTLPWNVGVTTPIVFIF